MTLGYVADTVVVLSLEVGALLYLYSPHLQADPYYILACPRPVSHPLSELTLVLRYCQFYCRYYGVGSFLTSTLRRHPITTYQEYK